MARSRQVGLPAPRRLILDSGAVIALARRDQRALAFLARALELRVQVEIPVVVVAEVVRGGPRDGPRARGGPCCGGGRRPRADRRPRGPRPSRGLPSRGTASCRLTVARQPSGKWSIERTFASPRQWSTACRRCAHDPTPRSTLLELGQGQRMDLARPPP